MNHKIYVNDSTKSIVLGHQGENNALVFLIDYSEWVEEFGSGTLSISNQRPGEDNPYPISVPHTGNVASWTITSNETAYPGDGYCQIIYSVGGTNVKSRVLKTAVLKSASGAGQDQDPWQGYIDTIAEYAAEVQSFKDDLTGGTNGQVWTKGTSGSSWKNPVVDEAPNDGKQYARKNKAWAEVVSSGGGATTHNELDGRSASNAHPMSAITGLESALNAKTSKTYVDEEIADVRGDIPSEATVAGWGFTKNTGTYSKPSSGIPKTDLASAVQTSLGKADSAYQKPGSGVPKSDLSSSVQTSLGRADSALQEAPSDGNQYARKNGAWSVVEAGGGGAYTVVVTQSSSLYSTYTADKTYAEIREAVVAGNVVIAKLQSAVSVKWRYLRCTGRYNQQFSLEGTIPAHLTFAGIEDDGVITECTIYDDESITVESNGYQSTISDLATIRSGAGLGATAVQPAELADYATIEYVDDIVGDVEAAIDTIRGVSA